MPRSDPFEHIRSSYGAKLGVALLAVVALVVGFGFVVQEQTSATLQDEVETDLRTSAETRAAELDTWLSGIEGQIRLHSTRDVIKSGDTEAISDHLRHTAEHDALPEGVVAVHYYDMESQTIEASSMETMEGVNPGDEGAPFATDPPTFETDDDTYVTSPFTVQVVNFPVVSVISPVEGADGKALIYMINLKAHTQSFADSAGVGSTVVVDGEGQIVAHPNGERILTDYQGDAGVLSEGGFAEQGDLLVAGAGMQSHDWTVVVRTDRAAAFALGDQITSSVVGLILLALVSLAFVGVVVGSNTIVSLRHLAARADAMAKGDLDVDLSTTRTDEFGTLYGSFDQMRGELRSQIRETERRKEEIEEKNRALEATAAEYGDVMDAVADGDLTRRLDTDTDNEAMSDIAVSFNQMLDAVAETMAEVKAFSEHVVTAAERVDDGADEVTDASEQVTDATTEISAGAEQQTEALHDVSEEVDALSSSAEEIAATVDEVAEASERAASIGEEGGAYAERALEEMDAVERTTAETAEEVTKLAEELDAVGEVVEVIRDIAEETNLLALNASIEAARVGNGSGGADGAGFAVVADEVKELAEETASSAAEIEDRIERIQSRAGETTAAMTETRERIESGVETVESAIDALDSIADAAEETDESIQEIRDATAQQASSATAVVDRVDDVAAIGDQTADEAADAAAAAQQQTSTMTTVSDAAEQLTAQARELRTVLEDFRVPEEAGGDLTGGDLTAGGTVGDGLGSTDGVGDELATGDDGDDAGFEFGSDTDSDVELRADGADAPESWDLDGSGGGE
ncbi:methyl-accepting chemotaxis protein [Halobellus marinus]|uniref:methyl-accepting chemotaxis protein n=1 Tax=Halobellus TaxID=1073986 RepID=UPI0028A67D6F|nr:methyl-accepting chemotaxis protein [Halobellus sp. DFY28]